MFPSRKDDRIGGAAPLWFVLALSALSAFAYLWNLEVMALWGDEPIRGLVSLEMLLTGEYLVPHKGGDFYYDKPPLYNWMLSQLMAWTGRYDEWLIRWPAIVCFWGMAITIYWVGKREIGRVQGLVAAFAYLAGARIISYDSMLGHIDPLYSWLTFASFLLIYYERKRERWLLLFVGSWAIAAAGFMLKAMPSLLFQTFTLAVWLYDARHLRWLRRYAFGGQKASLARAAVVGLKGFHRLLCWQHALGLLVFALPVLTYFYFYDKAHSLEIYMSMLWDQSEQRTVVQKTVWETLVHLMLFPIDVLGQLAPFSLLIVAALHPAAWRFVRSRRFLWFCLLVLSVNIPAYWVSPGTYPRYLFMLYPLILMLLAAAAYQLRERRRRLWRIVDGALLALIVLLTPCFWFPAVVPQFQTAGWWLVALACSMLFAGIILLWLRASIDRWLLTAAAVFTLRLLFDFHAIPDRAVNSHEGRSRIAGLRIAKLAGNEPIGVYDYTPLNDATRYYITSQRMKVLPRVTEDLPDHWLIVSADLMHRMKRAPVDSFYVHYHHPMFYVLPPLHRQSQATDAQQ